MIRAASPPSVSPCAGERSVQRIFVLLAVAAAGMAALLSLLPPAGHDQLWFLMMARRWLGGAPIYGPQIFDSNPPGVVWLSAVPVLLGRALHLPVTLVAKSLVLFAAGGSALLSFTFLRRTDLGGPLPPAWGRRYATPALLFAAIVLFAVIPARDFGQRDQILSFLVLPYVLGAAVSFRQHRLLVARSAAGILAAVGICLKPHHALLPVAVELTLLLSPHPATSRLRQLFRPEPILILLLGMGYLGAIHQLAPLYFTLALPIVRDTYWAIGHLSIARLALQAIQLCILAAIAVLLFAICKPRSQTVLLLLAAGFAATLVYFLQGTGWYYQQLPGIVLFGAALALELLNFFEHRIGAKPPQPRGWPVAATAALCALALGLTTYFTGSPFTRERAYAPVFADPAVPDPSFFAALPPHAPVAILTTSVEAAMMPVQRFELTWAQRTDNLWLLPAILRSESPGPAGSRELSPARVASLDALQHRWMAEDLIRWRPALVLVARCQDPTVTCQELEGRHDNLLAWFLRDPAFAALWSRYTYAGSRGGFDAYTLR